MEKRNRQQCSGLRPIASASKICLIVGINWLEFSVETLALQFPPKLWRTTPRQLGPPARFVPYSKRTAQNSFSSSARPQTKSSAQETSPSLSVWNTWFPLVFARYTDTTRPTRHYLLGAPVVLWNADGRWFAMLDQCPHRLASLSEGRILETADIECPYHGWSFDGTSGACTRIPQQAANATISSRACAKALPCVERQGILWVHSGKLYSSDIAESLADSSDMERYLIEPLEREGVLYVDYMRDLPMEWSTLAENVMDPSHLPFTHHGTIGNRKNAGPFSLSLTRPVTREGITARRDTTPPGSVEFRAPHLVYSGTYRQNSFADWNVAYAVPTVPGKCRLLVRVVFEVSEMKPPLKWVFGTLFRGPSWLLHLNNHEILEDDNIFLHHQMHNYQNNADSVYLPTDSDQVVSAFQKWLRSHGGKPEDMWTPYTSPSAFVERDAILERDELLERGMAHTNQCTSCSKANMWLGRLEPILGVSSLLLLVKAMSCGTKLRWIAGILSIVTYSAKQKVKRTRGAMKVGVWPPKRNRI